jgi:hypothetical protein
MRQSSPYQAHQAPTSLRTTNHGWSILWHPIPVHNAKSRKRLATGCTLAFREYPICHPNPLSFQGDSGLQRPWMW